MPITKAFSLIEALIALVIVSVVVLSIVGLIEIFIKQLPDRVLLTCLVESASSAVKACENGIVLNSVQCASYNVSITINGNCNPPQNTCSNIVVTASADDKSFTLNGVACNFQ